MRMSWLISETSLLLAVDVGLVARLDALALCLVHLFFFSSRRRHTRLQGDWSSDVCSSDLATWPVELRARITQLVLGHQGKLRKLEAAIEDQAVAWPLLALRLAVQLCHARREDRKSVV